MGKSLTEKAILIQLQIGRFSAMRKDTRVTNEVARDENTTVDYVKVTKNLLKGETFKAVQNLEQKIRTKFYKLTAAWNKDGERIIKITDYLKAKLELEEMAREYYSAVDNLVGDYDNLVESDKVKLGSMFNPSDYPSKSTFRSRFYVEIVVKPIEKTDFRSGVLSNEEVSEINNAIEVRLNNAVRDAQRDNINRVKEKLNHLFDRLVDSEGKFHSSSIENLQGAISEAQALNISDDDGLNTLFDSLKDKFSKYNADTIRANSDVRMEVMTETQKSLSEINEVMKSFM